MNEEKLKGSIDSDTTLRILAISEEILGELEAFELTYNASSPREHTPITRDQRDTLTAARKAHEEVRSAHAEAED